MVPIFQGQPAFTPAVSHNFLYLILLLRNFSVVRNAYGHINL